MEQVSKSGKTKIVYIYDALCGWCYGFSPVISKIHETYQDAFEFEIISGGLKIGSAVGPIGEIAPYIKAGAYKDVEKMSGVRFGDVFVNGPLQEGTMILNSMPPAIALSIVKAQLPHKSFEFGSLLQYAVYYDGMHPEDIDAYEKYAAQIGLDSDSFLADMKKPEYLEMAEQDIGFAQRLGIRGFPSMIGIKGESAFWIARGYTSYEEIESRLRTI